ncbi:hypothetical protein ACFPOE_06470 [Caenimonas terrae]|uniref:NAD(P)-binding domain-containing protein n=1 Tax=Caenimonas terrae TaxID=696074 RepID=A0ABW0NB25_9BURK
MPADPFQALQAAARRPGAAAGKPALLIAGATGALGNEMLRRLAGSGRHGHVNVLAREPMTEGLRGVACLVVPPEVDGGWPAVDAQVGVILFDPPRLFYDRERALWTPRPDQLPALALWMRRCGVTTLAVVLPHAQGRLPDALKRGLASLDEHAVAALGFERVLFVRSAQKPVPRPAGNLLRQAANLMLSVFHYMVPGSEQPVRATKVSELVAAALQIAPPGIHVAGPELVWSAAQGNLRELVAAWLAR